VPVAGKSGKEDDIGLGDGPSRRNEKLPYLIVFEKYLFHGSFLY
jgi:hypothetical protein